jgi:uncharacterized BrkB/YihY/UPF0761 family membrane protein
VTPDEESLADGDEQPPGRRHQASAHVAAMQKRAKRVADRAQAERERHRSVDAVFEMADHDLEVGGSIMAGALAYRLFIWLLPLALVVVAGLGFAAQASSKSPESAAGSVGLAGLVSNSVAGAASSSTRWYALLIGIPILIYATRSVAKTLIVAHRLIWSEGRGTVARPTLVATLQLLGALVAYFVVSALANVARQSSGVAGVLVNLLIPLPFAALWLFVSMQLPHRGAPWRALVPGAMVFGIGVQALHVATAYFIAPQAGNKQSTYGSLGIAAALLLGLFLFSRLIIATAVVNATLWARRNRQTEDATSVDGEGLFR